ncbi:MAG TPA: TonB-dependent receptor plug domain-containing protein [Gemmatimonadaceae bacterium]|nr:TonB-dependent receptor plug domain-containing protein [Gemmatimonadaceae bacterium]
MKYLRITTFVGVVLAPSLTRAQAPLATIDSAVLERTTERTIADALRGKVAGLRVVTTSGAPGSVPAIVIRNSASNGATDPVFIIDGVPTRLGLAEISVRDIERIEVLKGAATATEHGIGASNGVIVITTKRRPGDDSSRASVDLRSEFGMNSVPTPPPTSARHAFQLTADGRAFVLDGFGNRIRETDRIADNLYPAYLDPSTHIVGSRATVANFLSASGRLANVGAYASLSHDRDAGVVKGLVAYRRQQARVTLDRSWLSDRLRVAGSAHLARSEDDAPESLGALYGRLHFIEPWVRLDSVVQPCPGTATNCYPAQVYAGSSGPFENPLLAIVATPTDADTRRLQGQLAASYAMNDWLGADARISTDRRTETMHAVREPTIGNPLQGFNDDGDTARVSYTVLGLSAQRANRDGTIRTRTRLQYSDEQMRQDAHTRTATGGASVEQSSFTRQTTRTLSIATTAEIGEQWIVSGAISRPDVRSTLSSRDNPVYHRLGASYAVNADVRLRGGYGTSSPPFPRVEEIDFFTQSLLHRPFATEWEAGADVRLPRNLLGSYTWSRQRTNAYLGITFLPLTLGSRPTWGNIGDVQGQAHELSIRGPVLTGRAVRWDAALDLHRVSARIVEMSRPEFITAGGTFIRGGEPIGRIYGRRWIRNADQLAETIAGGWLPGSAADYVVNDEGFYVRAAEIGTAAEVPLPYQACPALAPCTQGPALLAIGNFTPDFELGFVNDVRIGPVSVSATLTGVVGGDIMNQQHQLATRIGRAPEVDQSARTSGTPKPESYYAAKAIGLGPNELFVESATHIALRELTLEWTLPPRWFSRLSTRGARVGLAGWNLWTSGSYGGYDPDVHPRYRTLVATLKLGV